ncbi:MAG: septum site-determining protein MinD [Deltaproteobacteria bacterium]|nr:septum site-determining protein MinD [Deltaproteobacteria bacterium]
MSGKAIVITSGKGGVGKTTTTANLGAALALKGKRVLVIDADIGLRNLDVIMGLENRIVFTIVDVAKGVCKPQQAIIKSKKSNNLFLLPASQTDEKDVLTEREFANVVNKLKSEFNFILIDSPAGIERGFRNACAGADSAIIVTTPDVAAIRDADRVIGLLSAQNIDARLLINRVDKDMVRKGDMLSPQDVIDILGIEQIGMIDRDNAIIVSANTGEPVVYNTKISAAGRAYMRVAERLTGSPDVPQEDLNIGLGLWAKLGKRLRAA